MKLVYCSVCGTAIPVIRKAMAKYATIIDIIEPHTCLDEPVVMDLKPIINPRIDINKKENKFVQSLNDLQPLPINQFGTDNLRDRRFESPGSEPKQKSSAPSTVIGMLDAMVNSIPERDLTAFESEE